MRRAVVLLSGGLDSATVLAVAKSMGFSCYALSVCYGQRNHVELLAAKRVSRAIGVMDHRFADLDLRCFGHSSLTADIDVPLHKDHKSSEIPNTYVPARNTIMLSYALAYAEVVEAHDIFFGANIHDYAGYPDCRPEYIEAFSAMANLATKHALSAQHRVTVHAPLLYDTKAAIIQRGSELGVDYGLTHSCYNPLGDKACGECSSCFFRRKGFVEAKVPDPTRYAYEVL